MPYQVSWQFVSMKSQTPVHVLGADADVVADVLAGAALLAAGSAAHAPLAAPAAAKGRAAILLDSCLKSSIGCEQSEPAGWRARANTNVRTPACLDDLAARFAILRAYQRRRRRPRPQ